MTKTSRSKEPMTYEEAMHELRKAHKGLRRQSNKVKILKEQLKMHRELEFQFHMAVVYMVDGVNIEPFNGWHPAVKYWLNRFNAKHD